MINFVTVWFWRADLQSNDVRELFITCMSTILIHDGVKEYFPEMEQSPFKRQDASLGKKQIWGACKWDHDMTSIQI